MSRRVKVPRDQIEENCCGVVVAQLKGIRDDHSAPLLQSSRGNHRGNRLSSVLVDLYSDHLSRRTGKRSEVKENSSIPGADVVDYVLRGESQKAGRLGNHLLRGRPQSLPRSEHQS